VPRLSVYIVVGVLVALVSSAPMLTAVVAATAGGYAPAFELGGAVQRPGSFTLETLRRYTSSKVDVVFGNGGALEGGSFAGVPLWDLIREAGVRMQPGRKNDPLRKYILVTGSDGYQVTLALAEVIPEFGGEPVLVAYLRDGKPLGPEEGMARLVVPHDKRGGRYVSNIARIEVRDPE
jgi:DMSO/TMAO reductase YedYZ molybdopterin-dependent catalytic subunit